MHLSWSALVLLPSRTVVSSHTPILLYTQNEPAAKDLPKAANYNSTYVREKSKDTQRILWPWFWQFKLPCSLQRYEAWGSKILRTQLSDWRNNFSCGSFCAKHEICFLSWLAGQSAIEPRATFREAHTEKLDLDHVWLWQSHWLVQTHQGMSR